MAFNTYDKLTWCLENGVPVGEERDYMNMEDDSDMVRKVNAHGFKEVLLMVARARAE